MLHERRDDIPDWTFSFETDVRGMGWGAGPGRGRGGWGLTGGADEGEVQGVEEQHHVFALVAGAFTRPLSAQRKRFCWDNGC